MDFKCSNYINWYLSAELKKTDLHATKLFFLATHTYIAYRILNLLVMLSSST